MSALQEKRETFIKELAYKFLRSFLPYEAKGEYFSWPKYVTRSLPASIEMELNFQKIEPSVLNEHDLQLVDEMVQIFFEKNEIKPRTLEEYEGLIATWHTAPEDNKSLHSFLQLSWTQYSELVESNSTLAQNYKTTKL